MKEIKSGVKTAMCAAMALGLAMGPAAQASAQTVAQSVSGMQGVAAGVPVLPQLGTGLGSPSGAQSNFRLGAGSVLPSAPAAKSPLAAAAVSPAVAKPAPAATAVSQAVPSSVSPAVVRAVSPAVAKSPLAATAVSQAVPSAVSPAVARVVSPAVSKPAPQRQAVREGMAGLKDAVRSMPAISQAPAAQAHGFGTKVEGLMTRTMSRSAEGAVEARAAAAPRMAAGAEGRLQPALPPQAGETVRREVPAPGQDPALQAEVEAMGATIRALKEEVGRVIVGQQEMVESIIAVMIAREHILLEGLPGVAKTRTVTAFAEALGADIQVIQGTPDKMPADIVGAEMLQEDPATGKRALVLEKGPIFANLVLADEVNRMMPKTQSALLSAMQERRVTVGRQKMKLPEPFLLLATQNPLEQEGVYPLPEAQLDRFMYKVIVPQPGREERLRINDLNRTKEKVTTKKVMGIEDLMKATELAERVHMSDSLRLYVQDILDAAQDPSKSGIGEPGVVSQAMITRASIFMEKAARINALMKGRSWVTPEDVRDVAPRILRHRIMLSYTAGDLTTDQLIEKILAAVPVPKAETPASGKP